MRTFSIINFVCLLLSIGIHWNGFTQPKSLAFQHLSVQQGLSQNSVLCIQQDREGFMWFGTEVGLNKYDGYAFTIFNPDPRDSKNTLRDNYIFDIHEDNLGRLWVATTGLHLVDKRTGKVAAYLVDSMHFSYLNVNVSIYEDKHGILWTSVGGGLNRFDPATKKFTTYKFPELVPNQALIEDNYGHFWMGSTAGLYQFNPKTGAFTSYLIDSSIAQINPSISALYLDAAGILWIGTQGNGVFQLNTRDKQARAVSYNPKKQVNNWISHNGIIEDDMGYIWLATSEGLQCIDKNINQITTYRSNPAVPGSLSSNNILSVYLDREGTLWIGTDNGVNKAIANAKPFHTYQVSYTSQPVHFRENIINTILEDRNGIVWLGTPNGLYQYIPQQQQVKHISLTSDVNEAMASPDAKTLQNIWISAIKEDETGQLWIGTQLGLYCLNRSTGKSKFYPCKIPVQFIGQDSYGRFWIPGGDYTKRGEAVIAVFDLQKLKFSYTDYKLDDTAGLKDMYLNGVMVSRNGDLWIATQSNGISRMNLSTGKFIHYPPDYQSHEGYINDQNVYALYEDESGIIWAGTSKGGLNRLDPKTGVFTYFTMHEGLPSNQIESITGDKSGNLWIGTNNGLSRFNIKAKTFRNFDISDGLPANEFTIGSVFSHNGKLMFGTVNGFVIFHPDSIKANRTVPPVYITGLKILEKPKPLPVSQLELSYKENFLAFDFVALNYNSPEKNQYAYQLTGLDPNWIHSGNRRYASYTGLPPGRYIFRVKAANNDGIWNEQGASLTVIIYPPWWQTWWAYSIYGLLFLAGVYAVHRFQKQRLIQKERERAKEKELAQAREIEKAYDELKATQAQLIQSEKMASLGQLTAGIAHEIQNPLNFVNNFSEINKELIEELRIERDNPQMQEEIINDIEQNLDKVIHHGKRADNIVKGMLQHSRANTGKKELADINALVDESLRLSYHGFRAKDKAFNAEINTDFDERIGKINAVPQDISRVLINLLNNAFYAVHEKKAQLNGTYEPTVAVCTKKLDDKVVIYVKDNGNGIPQRIIDKIFQPFFTTKPTGQGTGLGLSLSYDIVKAHGGEIKVETREQEGSEFVIQLPKLTM